MPRTDFYKACSDLAYTRDTYPPDDPLHHLAIAGLALAEIVKLSLSDHLGPKASHQSSVLPVIKTISDLSFTDLACVDIPALYTLARTAYIFEATFFRSPATLEGTESEGEG